jgi:RND family efflux transporter MFP subunit
MTNTNAENGHCFSAATLLLVAALVASSCAGPSVENRLIDENSWSITAWGSLYEVFPELDPLIAGEAAAAHTHVTALDGFTPVIDGTVEIVLSSPTGEQVFAASEPVRPGIFNVEIQAETPGEFDLAFRISSAAGQEEVRGGRIRVGTVESPGGVIVAPAPKGATDGGEPLSFLKEEQWRSDFATSWVREDSLMRSVTGLARVRPPAGGAAMVTSPVDGVLRPEVWPYPGSRVERGTPLFSVVPRVAADRSLPTLEAELASLQAELSTAKTRYSRLEELYTLEATSQRELEEARARVETLEARYSAASRDLESANSARRGGDSGALTIRAPFSGEIASVSASPGETVTAGNPLARLVRTDRLWLEVSLAPQVARQLDTGSVSGAVLTFPEGPPVRFEEGLRLVSVAPEMDPETGTVTVLLEAPPTAGLILGTSAQAQVLLAETLPGIVVPASALVDDGGVSVVYLQLSGESFARQEVNVLERQGDRLLVDRLVAGQRLVDRGGEAIRRSSLMASGEAHGHVH